MTFLVERVAELQKYLRHAKEIRSRGVDQAKLAADLTLRNDVLFTLLTIAQLVIDIAGELGARHGERFTSYREAIGSLRRVPQFPSASSMSWSASPASAISSFTNTSGSMTRKSWPRWMISNRSQNYSRSCGRSRGSSRYRSAAGSAAGAPAARRLN